jgi:4,5-dihydroxyphthalate decarboxylase
VSKRVITAVFKDYDHLHPLAAGDISSPNLEVRCDRHTPLGTALGDETVTAVEISWARHIRRLSEGDNTWVAIPSFPRRAFGHRAWYTHRDNDAWKFGDLNGTVVGTNEWPATGNTWARAAAREAGLEIEKVSWVIGDVDDELKGSAQTGDVLPENARYADGSHTLLEMLLTRELDALVCPIPPEGFYEKNAIVRRLLPDFQAAERSYFQRTGIYPAHHVVGLRRAAFEADPQLATDLFDVLERSRRHWQATRLMMGDTSPWLLADIEDVMVLMGPDWQPGGDLVNHKMTATLCSELFAQGLVDVPVDPDQVFAEFSAVHAG